MYIIWTRYSVRVHLINFDITSRGHRNWHGHVAQFFNILISINQNLKQIVI
jgi:hypothetical protein